MHPDGAGNDPADAAVDQGPDSMKERGAGDTV
jgi:hypothetical protein